MTTKAENKRILFVTGGTGGHIFPALSIYSFLKKSPLEIFFATDKRGLNNIELSKLNPYIINAKGYAGKSFFSKVIALVILLRAVIEAIFFLKTKNIKIVLGFGSYVQVPFVLAALLLKRKVILHEANAVLGRANKLFWKYVSIRTSAYKLEKQYKNTINVGMPVRNKILKLYKKNKYRVFVNNKINLLIIGGSLGSASLSYDLSKSIVKLPLKIRKKLYVTHQVLFEDLVLVKDIYKRANINCKVYTFIKNINSNLEKASLVISRAGASAIAENAIAGIPAIYFPIPNSVKNHQYLNALKFKKEKAAWILNDEDIKNGNVLIFLKKIFNNIEILKLFAENNSNLAKPKATAKLSKLIMDLTNASF